MSVLPPQVWPEERLQHHVWVDVREGGQVHAIDAPLPQPLEGMGVGQLLRDLCVWPDDAGVPHTLPLMTRHASRELCLANLLRVLQVSGDLSDEGRQILQRNLPELGEAMRWSDVGRREDFTQYMTTLARRGDVRPERARTAAEHAARDERATAIVSSLLVAQRTDEINQLAQAVGVRERA